MSGPMLAVAVFALPFTAGALGFALTAWRPGQRVLAWAALAVTVGASFALVTATRGGMVVTVEVGGWPGGLAIVLAVDLLSAVLLSATSLVALLGVVFAAASGEDAHPLFHPLVLTMWSGVALALVTADLFNLFVAFEVMLISSYVLLTIRGGREQVRAGVVYVATNLAASTLFLLGVGLIYGALGTVNLARVAEGLPGSATATAGLLVLLIAVAAKASIVPLHGWLPRTYVHAGPAVTAIFSALLTKVGVYVLYRLTSTMLIDLPGFTTIALIAAGVTMVLGVLGAVGGTDMRGILTFHMVSQVGYLVLPLGLWSRAAVAAGLLYLVQYVAVKGALLLTAAVVVRTEGSDRLADVGGLLRTHPWLGIAFLVPALALAGLPPTSGFVGKFLLVRAAFDAQAWAAGATAIAVSLLTLLSMIKIFTHVFWGSPPQSPPDAATEDGAGPLAAADLQRPSAPTRTAMATMVGIPLAIGVGTLVLGVTAAPLLSLTSAVADQLLDPSAYLAAVRR